MNPEQEQIVNKFRLSIGRRIGIGFGALIVITLLIFTFAYSTSQKSKKISDLIVESYTPSLERLDDLNLLIVRSKMLINNWVFMKRPPGDPGKEELVALIKSDYPKLKEDLVILAKGWETEESKQLDTVFNQIDALFASYDLTMLDLSSTESYEDPGIMFLNIMSVEEGDIKLQSDEIRKRLEVMVAIQQNKTESESEKMIGSFNTLNTWIIFAGFMLLFGGSLIAFLTIRTIVVPIYKLKEVLLRMSKGLLPDDTMEKRDDEIGDMQGALDLLIDA